MIGGMTGALVWKEWRTLRGLLIANVVLCLIAPLALSAWSAAFLQDRAGDSMAVLLLSTSLFAVLPIFAAACGATVIAGERSVTCFLDRCRVSGSMRRRSRWHCPPGCWSHSVGG